MTLPSLDFPDLAKTRLEFITCSAEGQKGLSVLFDQGLPVTGQREPVQDQGQEVMGDHSSQVPLELPQDQHLPVLERGEEGGAGDYRRQGKGVNEKEARRHT